MSTEVINNLVYTSVDDLKSSLSCNYREYSVEGLSILHEAFNRLQREPFSSKTKRKLLASYIARMLKQKAASK